VFYRVIVKETRGLTEIEQHVLYIDQEQREQIAQTEEVNDI